MANGQGLEAHLIVAMGQPKKGSSKGGEDPRHQRQERAEVGTRSQAGYGYSRAATGGFERGTIAEANGTSFTRGRIG